MNISYQYNKRAGKSIRLLSFVCSECKEESIVEFFGQGKYTCTNCGWKIELVKEYCSFEHKPMLLPLPLPKPYKQYHKVIKMLTEHSKEI